MVNDRSSSKLAMLVTPKPKLDSVSDGSDRINARFPNKMIELMDAAAQQKGVSRSRWVSEAIIEFKRIHLDTHLEFLKEIDDKAEQEKRASGDLSKLGAHDTGNQNIYHRWTLIID